MAQVAEPKVKIDEDAQRLLSLAIQIADKTVEWSDLMQAEKESGNSRATFEILQAEAALLSLVTMYRAQLAVYHGLAEDESDELPG